MQYKRSFTLIEVLTVIFIFGILVSITGYVYSSSLSRSRDTQRLSDLNNIKTTLEQYYLDNKTYPYNAGYKASQPNGTPWVAKYELERYVLDSPACDNGASNNYLAPHYITVIPEDPRYQLINNLSASCTLTQSAGYGQYLYVSLAVDEATHEKVGQYYLMARLERVKHVSDNFPDISQFPLSLQKISEWNSITGYCDDNTGVGSTHSSCIYNYYLKNSNND